MAAPEGLIAISGVGRWVYALGYWGHRLYQYDTHSGALSSTTVGSVGGHVSRQLIADADGHVYVPRLRVADALAGERAWRPYRASERIAATLVEYDTELNPVGETPLQHYASASGDPAARSLRGRTGGAEDFPDRVRFGGHLRRIVGAMERK